MDDVVKKNKKASNTMSIINGNLPATPVDCCSDHLVREAEHELFEQAFSRIFARDAESLEKSAALLTACCIISKISFEKFVKNLKKVCKTSSKRLKPEGKKKRKKSLDKKKDKNEQTPGKTVL